MIRLPDGQSAEVAATSLPTDIQPGVRVRCLASNPEGASTGPLNLQAIVIAVGKPPVVKKQTQTGPSKAGAASLSSRGEDAVLLRCKRAILYFNPRLSPQDVELIASSIVNYSRHLGVDPFFVVAVVAAESRFNPKARSYKGAMGLGQLMPGTARGMGVRNPYDPMENIGAAVRILRGNLEKYQGQPYQEALALAAYNAGSGAVEKYGGVPPYRETRDYIWKVHEYFCLLHGIPPEPRPKK
ncbi:MAG: transglycosylase SLT domain-containing protein [Armatimonadetes bacterium]|nr:transglycosylase SLT domain-containing protein [Armatimonadota bacterium]NIM23308.1 transglycosylase SLT domain-containing protein [Armatimonadota bacterium]NIM67172.1 transglycosylase SLT domain-containing protein [Armatimonadota bacterium]NIM75699.1 transglycosylase SLT domain-containing protein [Armatimonadota bacterium]NIN05361.1 transglycosylase SLT domain-containing protein [Armatimonadota bacterium]